MRTDENTLRLAWEFAVQETLTDYPTTDLMYYNLGVLMGLSYVTGDSLVAEQARSLGDLIVKGIAELKEKRK